MTASMMEQLAGITSKVINEVYGLEIAPVFTRTAEEHGDFATNAAMQLAKDLGRQPREIAESIAEKLRLRSEFADVSVAGPGFINIRVSDEILIKSLSEPTSFSIAGKTVLLEYSCPNAFKELHTGHLYQTLIGDAMGRIYETAGAKVVRTSFGGDVGLHAAKCMWGILQNLGSENSEALDKVENRAAWISDAYVLGSSAYEENETSKKEIDDLNKKIYEMFGSGDTSSSFARIFFTARQWSYDYFNEFYASIGAEPFDRYYPESETLKPGLEIVNAHKGRVFTESDGAVVLDETKTGLHTRVFVTSSGLPTYETKDLGVIHLENKEFPYEKRLIVTGNDQSQYMQVIFAALKLIDPELAAKQNHVANGTVRFGDGTKMSSRLGNVARAVDVISGVEESVDAKTSELKRAIALGAVKYSLLKGRVGSDISFDLEQSIGTEGNSGPYLQYALVRARSILRNAAGISDAVPENLDPEERRLAIKLSEFPESLHEALQDFSPHHACTYLYELAQVFNRFYENSRVLDDPRSSVRISLVRVYERVLSSGLELLGIPKPEEM